MSQPSNQNRQTPIGLLTLESADQSARTATPLLPDTLVFDPDSKRMGDFGGFFLANDYNAASYTVASASRDPKSLERVNSPTNRIPGIHLPALVHFSLVASGPLYTVSGRFNYEAIVVCKEVTSQNTGEYALLKLTTKGPAAVKLHSHFTIAINDPLTRLNTHYHQLARQLFHDNQIPESRLNNILKRQATPQMIWIPVETRKQVQIGRDQEKSVIGAMVYTDEPIPNSTKFNSRWPSVPLERLTTPDINGGLLLTGQTQIFCQRYRQHYEEILLTRALNKGQIQSSPPEPGLSNSLPSSAPPPTREDYRRSLLAEVRTNLSVINKIETDPDVVKRITQFGATSLDDMPVPQLKSFNNYVQAYTLLQNQQRPHPPHVSTAA